MTTYTSSVTCIRGYWIGLSSQGIPPDKRLTLPDIDLQLSQRRKRVQEAWNSRAPS